MAQGVAVVKLNEIIIMKKSTILTPLPPDGKVRQGQVFWLRFRKMILLGNFI